MSPENTPENHCGNDKYLNILTTVNIIASLALISYGAVQELIDSKNNGFSNMVYGAVLMTISAVGHRALSSSNPEQSLSTPHDSIPMV